MLLCDEACYNNRDDERATHCSSFSVEQKGTDYSKRGGHVTRRLRARVRINAEQRKKRITTHKWDVAEKVRVMDNMND